jgi:hydroxymethylbilane synthase
MQIRIGTRASKLALIQADQVKQALLDKHHNLTAEQIVIVPITTTGDKILDKNLYEIGGKGLFVKEIEEALLNHTIDLAVHSMKDMPAFLPDHLTIDCVLEREDPRDAFLSKICNSIATLPANATLGTSSPRRAAQVLKLRPDIQIVTFRGNVDTRLKKLENKVVDATILAVAGLKRCQVDNSNFHIIDEADMLPAVAQGAIGVECRSNDNKMLKLLDGINHQLSYAAIIAERGFLKGLNANCNVPVAAYAKITGENLHLKCLIATVADNRIYRTERRGLRKDGYELGWDAALELKKLFEAS